MYWFKKIQASMMPIDQIDQHLIQAISLYVGGNWNIIENRKLMPSYRLQKYGSISLQTQNYKMEGDKVFVRAFYEVAKFGTKIPNPPIADPTSNATQEWEQQYGKGETVTEYDNIHGHRLLSIRGYVEAWRPGMMPIQELGTDIYKIIGKQRPEYTPRGLKRIGEFDSLDSPFEVAQYVKSTIDRFFNGGFDNSDPEPNPETPIPSTSLTPSGV